MTEKELEEMIEYANTKYHGEGENPTAAIMTDNEYDIETNNGKNVSKKCSY